MSALMDICRAAAERKTYKELKAENERLRALLTGPFICGAIGEPGVDGLHRGYLVCPASGSDIIKSYTANG